MFRLHCMKDMTKFPLWRNFSKKLRMLQERSDSLIQSTPRIQPRPEARKSSVTATTSTPGRQYVVTKVQPRLLRFRFSQLVKGKAFWVERAEESMIDCLQKKAHYVNDLFSASPPWSHCGLCQYSRMEEICEYKCLLPVSPKNHIVAVVLVLVYSKQSCLQMPSAAGLRTGCMHRWVARSRNRLLCETKCEVICCDQNPGQTG